MKAESFKILNIFKPTEKLVGGNHTMNTTCTLQLESPLLVSCHNCSACVHTHAHPHVHFVHADPGEALRWRGGTGPRKAGHSSPASNGVCSDTYVPGPSWAVAKTWLSSVPLARHSGAVQVRAGWMWH